MISIDKMSVEEKIQTMELLWEDLCKKDNVQSPDWHQEVLKNRANTENAIDWEQAKENLLNKIK